MTLGDAQPDGIPFEGGMLNHCRSLAVETRNAVFLACFVLLAANSAVAATVEQIAPLSENFFDVTFAPFDSSLGTLTSVTATLFGTSTIAAGPIEFTRPPEGPGLVGAGIFLLDLPGIPLLQAIFNEIAVTCVGSQGAQSCTYPGATQTYSVSETASDISGYISGQITRTVFSFTSFSPVDINSDAEGFPSSAWSRSGDVKLVYTYDPFPDTTVVPLPAPLSLLAAALGGLALLRRARKA
jgi:hypothetical protein